MNRKQMCPKSPFLNSLSFSLPALNSLSKLHLFQKGVSSTRVLDPA